MQVEQILQQWDLGHPQPGWMTFRYRPIIGLARLIYPLMMAGLAWGAWALLFGRHFLDHPLREAIQLCFADQRSNLVFPFLFGGGVIALWVVWRRAREVMSSGSNVLLLTPEGVVKRFQGRVEHYPWPCVAECTNRLITGRSIIPEVAIQFVDARDQRLVHLVRGRYFGHPNIIMQGLGQYLH